MTQQTTKRLAVIQSAYIPWKGYFDLISRADVFVIYDSAQYSKNHWHNRNKIKRATGDGWLTIPVKTSGRMGQAIQDVEISDNWADRHWSLIEQSYRETPYFREEAPAIQALFNQAAEERYLSRVNELFLRALAKRLGLSVEITRHEKAEPGDPSARLVSLCESLGATHYISGPSAHSYLKSDLFGEAGISVEWMTYGPYSEYTQPHGDFTHAVSVIDLLFCTGPAACDLFPQPSAILRPARGHFIHNVRVRVDTADESCCGSK